MPHFGHPLQNIVPIPVLVSQVKTFVSVHIVFSNRAQYRRQNEELSRRIPYLCVPYIGL